KSRPVTNPEDWNALRRVDGRRPRRGISRGSFHREGLPPGTGSVHSGSAGERRSPPGGRMAAQVTVYSNVGWTGCHKAMEYLSRKGITYTEKNLSRMPQARQELIEMGVMSLPVILIGEQRLVGFFPAQIDSALKAAGLG